MYLPLSYEKKKRNETKKKICLTMANYFSTSAWSRLTLYSYFSCFRCYVFLSYRIRQLMLSFHKVKTERGNMPLMLNYYPKAFAIPSFHFKFSSMCSFSVHPVDQLWLFEFYLGYQCYDTILLCLNAWNAPMRGLPFPCFVGSLLGHPWKFRNLDVKLYLHIAFHALAYCNIFFLFFFF